MLLLLIHGEGGVVLICRLVIWIVGQDPVGDGLGLAVGRLRIGPAPRRDRAGLREQGRQAVEDGALLREDIIIEIRS